MEINRIETLQVIFKVSERCNLNCPYCYYFSGADKKIELRPAVIKGDVIQNVCAFLERSCDDLEIPNIQIIFHGGEPTLLKPNMFDFACRELKSHLQSRTNLSFSIQTNGVHIPDIWLHMFKEYEVAVGVSLDGPANYNDPLRPDHFGRGSHARIIENIERLKTAHANHAIRNLGLVSVLNSSFDYEAVYDHFVNELGMHQLNFLLPDQNQDISDEAKRDAHKYGDVLIKLFDLWLLNDQENIKIREIERFLDFFKRGINFRNVSDDVIVNQIIVIHSDGHLGVDDTFMPAASWFSEQPTSDVNTTTLRAWLKQPVFDEIRKQQTVLPEACTSCKWRGICRGGDIENRFSVKNGFANKTVYCGAMMKFLDHVSETLLLGGFPETQLESAMDQSVRLLSRTPEPALLESAT
jgi:uncharacterized protein